MKFSVQDQMERGRVSLLVIEIKEVPTCVNVEPCSTSVRYSTNHVYSLVYVEGKTNCKITSHL
ncbi:hypothetical protein TorRG33x02_244170 [Trema orientale]|uniref:Uncharacterized protein n=1 Tax=Trema orientale TaxID=63057 RepID=A0A2P5DRV8_TREOI|nr:hypothetical protein TorRG33x02_244170 [Trema orientale]